MKKAIIIWALLTFILPITIINTISERNLPMVSNTKEVFNSNIIDESAVYSKTFEVNLLPQMSNRSSILAEAQTGKIIFEQNSNEKYPIASMVKIMTLNIIFDSINNGKLKLSDVVEISHNAAGMGGSQAFLDVGEKYMVETLIKTIIIASANDSCVALAETISGSEEAFVTEMNNKAQKMEMKNTHYENCTGLPSLQEAYSTAKDVFLCMKQLIQYNDYFKYSKIWMDELVHPSGRITNLTNTNKLVKFYNGCDGGKTGFTNEAKHCLCATASRNGLRLISVVLGGVESKTRFADSSAMLNYGFANFESKKMLMKEQIIAKIPIVQGILKEVEISSNKDLYLFGEKGKNKGEIRYDYPTSIKAPLNAGDKIGKVYVYNSDNQMVDSADIIVNNTVKKATLWDKIKEILGGK
ncbi:MAG: D-alanyl-D-alanine carboxypeptidase family protein [Clostridia bacterium]